MLNLSDVQIGYLRRKLSEALSFIPGPCPSGDADAIRQWCHKVCGVNTLHDVGGRWATSIKELGRILFDYGLADRVRQDRPVTPEGLPVWGLKTPAEKARAILCLAVDAGEGNEVFEKVRRASRFETPVSEPERERATELILLDSEIQEALCNYLVVDEETLHGPPVRGHGPGAGHLRAAGRVDGWADLD
jgi:hypothetical protein